MSRKHPAPSQSAPSHDDAAHPAPSRETSPHPATALEKEFELERVILFSDAVFAIAITLLVIDIKFPEIPESLAGVDLHKLFRPTIFGFIAFALSFFFIGRSWAIHLKLFRLLRRYDQGLINRNLLFLFFIVTFPFTASGISGHLRTGFLFPFYLYLSNICCVSICHFILCRYIIYGKSNLAAEGEAAEKKYIYMRSMYTAVLLSAMTVLLLVIPFVLPDDKKDYIPYGCAAAGLIAVYINRKTKKYKPLPGHTAHPAP
jgi:uncharacterized membrane protein